MRSRLIPAYLCVLALVLNPVGLAFGDDDAEPTPAERARSQNNLKQIGRAIHNHHDVTGNFPGNVVDKDGKPLLSWRVQILPYIEETDLYKQFKLDEPWDSEHNKKLADKMPKLYAPVRGKAEKNTTFYTRLSGDGALLNPKKKLKFADVKDKLSNTIMVLEAATPVSWSKPEDLEFDANKELPKFGTMFKGDFNALFADGSVRYIKKDTDPMTLKALITVAGGETVKLPK
jgi:prepilin-type processing-associated H-X9-DG protein